MGWCNAFLCGLVYGAVLGGTAWSIWRAVTLAPLPLYGDVVWMYLAFAGFVSPLLIEAAERDKVKKGAKNLGAGGGEL